MDITSSVTSDNLDDSTPSSDAIVDDNHAKENDTPTIPSVPNVIFKGFNKNPELEPNPMMIEINGGKDNEKLDIKLLEGYTERSFLVVGNTLPIREILKEMGGHFNSRLKIGFPAWVFSNIHIKKVSDYVYSVGGDIEVYIPAENPEEKENQSDVNDLTSELRLVKNYTPRSFIVIGDTKPVKEKMKSMGGRFNSKLKIGSPGWVFPNDRVDEVSAYVISVSGTTEIYDGSSKSTEGKIGVTKTTDVTTEIPNSVEDSVMVLGSTMLKDNTKTTFDLLVDMRNYYDHRKRLKSLGGLYHDNGRDGLVWRFPHSSREAVIHLIKKIEDITV